MNVVKTIKRAGIVVLCIAILLFVITGLCLFLSWSVADSFNKSEDDLGKLFAIIFVVILIGVFLVIGMFSAVFGVINLITAITLLTSGNDIHKIKKQIRRIKFTKVILIITSICYVFAGVVYMTSNTHDFIVPVILLAFAIISIALVIVLSKCIKVINEIPNEGA